ncbi:MAG: hypothetical protein E4H13_05820 [Calditrichales bacterium]|nr:MAG: hypothetical protein E4H13_05820 [Calditrichales bacterium]
MAIKTMDLNEIVTKSANIYEACLVIAQRAREINGTRIAERKAQENLDDSGFEQEIDIYDRDFMDIEHEREINPTVIAQAQLLEGKIKYHYVVEKDTKFEEKEPSE